MRNDLLNLVGARPWSCELDADHSGSVILESTGLLLAECEGLCDATQGCSAITYLESTKHCSLNGLGSKFDSKIIGSQAAVSVPTGEVCSTTPAAVCAGSTEPCFYDPTCPGVGCNAGGHTLCRFCGFNNFVACPAPPPAADGASVLTVCSATVVDTISHRCHSHCNLLCYPYPAVLFLIAQLLIILSAPHSCRSTSHSVLITIVLKSHSAHITSEVKLSTHMTAVTCSLHTPDFSPHTVSVPAGLSCDRMHPRYELHEDRIWRSSSEAEAPWAVHCAGVYHT